MGYTLTIERDSNNPITKEDWERILATDKDFKKTDKLIGRNPVTGSTIEIPVSNCGLFKFENEFIVPFVFSEEFSFISVKNPNEFIIEKMFKIGEILDAKIKDEDGELFANDYLKKTGVVKKSWWKFW